MSDSSGEKYTKGLLFTAIATAILSTFSTTYQNVALNVPATVIKAFISQSFYQHYGYQLSGNALTLVWGFAVVAMWSLGAIIGAWLADPILEKFGRRNAICICMNLVDMVGFACFFLAKPCTSFELLIVGRFILGIGGGMSLVFFGVYLTEISPDFCRGTLSTLKFIPHCLSCILGQVLGLSECWGTATLWPLAIGWGIFPSAIYLAMTPLFPESPKFLYITLGEEEKARKVLKYLHGEGENIEEVLASYRRERDLTNSGKAYEEKELTIWQILKLRHLRIPFFLAILCNVSQNTCGYTVVSNYSSEIFQKIGFTTQQSQIASTLAYVPALFGAIFATATMEKIGRRPLMITGVCGGIAGLVILMICEYVESQWSSSIYISIVGVLIIILAYYIGTGPIPEYIFGELTPQATRSITASTANVLNWTFSLLYSSSYSYIHDAIGAPTQLLMIVPSIFILIYISVYLPETKGRPVDEIVAGFVRKKLDLDSSTPLLSDSLYKSK